MMISRTALRLTIDAAERAGISKERLLDGAIDPSTRMDWDTYVVLLEHLATLADHDVERLRLIGGHTLRAPPYEFFRRLSTTIFTLEALYGVAERWVAPVMFPHLPLEVALLPGRRVHLEGRIPTPYAPSVPFLRIFEGSARELPTLLGLPPATIVESEVTPRWIRMVLELPREPTSLRTRLRRSFVSVFRGGAKLDLLERQRAELELSIEDLRRASMELERLLDGLPDPVVIHRDGMFLWVNRALVETLGYTDKSALVGKPVIDFLHESSVQQTELHMRLPIGTQQDRLQIRFRRRDGEMIVGEVSPPASIVFRGVQARLVVGRDITERVRLQERLVTADRLSSLSLLAAGVAHEINNPLAYVLGSIENARRLLDATSPDLPQAQAALATALEGVDQVRAIVRDLGVLSRADERTLPVVDVRAVVDATLALAAAEIDGRARLVREDQPVPDARLSAARLGQVLLNLIVNALESMSTRPGPENELRLSTSTDSAGRPVISIADTGAGIPPELRSRIFDPFFTTKPNGQGTGLGLAICHQIITEAGGEIAVESTLGRGSTFRITLAPVR
jgi:PAS domain S-box-containing protein